MRLRRSAILVLLIGAIGATRSPAQSDQEKPITDTQYEAESEQETGPLHLSKPMQSVRTNLSVLEGDGNFKVVAKEYRVMGYRAAPAMVWNILITRPTTCRLAVMKLEKLRYVRFYSQGITRRLEAYSKIMHYSPRLAAGAANRRLLQPDEQFEVWVYVSNREIEHHRIQPIDSVEFRPLTRSGRDLSASSR